MFLRCTRVWIRFRTCHVLTRQPYTCTSQKLRLYDSIPVIGPETVDLQSPQLEASKLE